MNRKNLVETVFKALKSVNEEEEIEFKEKEVVKVGEPAPHIDGSSAGFQEVQDYLIKALDVAEAIGDEKLVTQIGNTITMVTRSQVKGAEGNVAETTTAKYTALAEKVVARIKETQAQHKAKLKEDWDSCIDKVMDQGKSQKSAEKICGAINRDTVQHYR